MSKGWIRLDRAITGNWVWQDKPFTSGQAWVDLLLGANHKPVKISLKRNVISLEVGQQARSELTLSDDWGWSRGKVRRFLKQLEKDEMIVQQKSHLTSVISICNYSSFQGIDTTDDTTDSTTDGTADGQQTDNRRTSDGTQTNKGRSPDNGNHENNGNNEMILKDLSPCSDDEEQQVEISDLDSYSLTMAQGTDSVMVIFNYWLEVMEKKSNTALSDKRKANIKKRLKDGYSVPDIKTAIFNCSNTDHNMGRGKNSNGTKYNDIELICRNPENLERFRDNPGNGRTEQDNDEFDRGGLTPIINPDQQNGSTFDHDSF